MISLEAALEIVDRVLADRRPKVVRVPLREAAGRVLAADVASPTDLPPFDRATMDGWAIPPGDGRTYRAAGVVNAGDLDAIAALAGEGAPPLAPGTAVRVMTGAPVPPGTARVVPVELARADGDAIEIDAAAGPVGSLPACVHARGRDLRAGEAAARAGERLDPLRWANLLACGATEVAIARAPRVAIAATGDELVDDPADLRPGRIVDANAPLLRELLARRGWPAGAHRPIADDPGATKARVAGMLGQHDVVVLTGGASVGDRDCVPGALRALGLTVHFDRVAVQPGKPTLFATGERGVVLALPGNPVSALVTAHLFVVPALARLEGERARPRFVTLPLAADWRGGPYDRVRLLPARLTPEGGARLLDYHGSGHLRALIAADGLVRLEPAWEARAAGEPVAFWPLCVAAHGEAP